MASNSFKVKNSLVLTPKDLSTLTNPEAGDLACDINDNNKIKRYDETLADWVEVGSGAGGGLDVFHTDSFDDIKNTSSFSTGNNASFLGGGTLAGGLSLESVSPISGINSLKYTQASGSLNDYFASEIIDVDLKQQKNTSGMTLYFTYDGNANDGRFIVWDETNDQEISNELALVETASKATRYSLSFHVPASCTQIRWGYQVLVENVGTVLLVDDVEMSSDPFVDASIDGFKQTLMAGSAAAGSSGSPATGFNATVNYGDLIVTQSTNRITAVKDCIVDINWHGIVTSAGARLDLYKNGVTLLQRSSAAYASGQVAAGSCEVQLSPGEYLEIQSANNGTNAISVVTHTTVATATTDAILTPSDTFSTDTAPLTYAPSSQYTLSTLENAPVGTFITFTYAANTNTRTQTTTAPTQNVVEMNSSGIFITPRPFNSSSFAFSPSAFAMQIGKGHKSVEVNLYKNLNKIDSGSTELVYNSTTRIGITYKEYNEQSGIIIIDAGACLFSSSTAAAFVFDNVSPQFSGFVTINASRKIPLLAVPTPQVAYLKDTKPASTNGGSSVAGSFQTRTLNTAEGDFNKFGVLNANQFTLQPGIYDIEASATQYQAFNAYLKIRNITDSTDALYGSAEFSLTTAGTSIRPTVIGRISITSSKTFELQYRVSNSKASDGLGVASSYHDNVYAQVKITKLS